MKKFFKCIVYNCDKLLYNLVTIVNIGGSMSKYDQMIEMLEKNNGYLFTSEVEKAGISRTYMARFIKDNNLEKASRGIYITEDTWTDQLYILQIQNPKIIFSGETALYLNQMIDREYSEICVSVPSGHNGFRLRDKGIIVHQENPNVFGMGICEAETNFGNKVRTYNKERCFCDTVKNRSAYEVQTFQTALKSYMRDKGKDLSTLMKYAEVLKIRNEVMKYVEVML